MINNLIRILSVIFAFFVSVQAQCLNLEQISKEDQKKLHLFFQQLIIDETFGYTLFGDKPVVETFWPFFPDWFEIKSKHPASLLNSGWKIWLKYEKLFPSKNFIFEEFVNETEAGKYVFIRLINKKKFDKTFKDNKKCLNKKSSVQHILDLMKNNEKSSHFYTVTGIFCGYGVNNVKHFVLKNQLQNVLSNLPQFPTKIPSNISLLSQYQVQSLKLSKKLSDENIRYNLNDLENITRNFITLSKERKSFTSLYPDGPMTLISLPDFMVDSKTEETKKLYESYSKTRQYLTSIMHSPNFLEIVLNQYCNGK